MKDADKGNNNENKVPFEHADLQQNIQGWDTQIGQNLQPEILNILTIK